MAKRKLNKAQLLRILAEQSDENLGDDVDECLDEQSDSEDEVIIDASEVEDEISCESDVEQSANTKYRKSVRSRRAIISTTRRIVTVNKPSLSAINQKVTAVSRKGSAKNRKGRAVTQKVSIVKRKLIRKVLVKVSSDRRKTKTKRLAPPKSPVFMSKDNTKWAKKPFPETSSEKMKINGITDKVTTPDDVAITNPVDIFKLFFSDDICQEIVRCTNTEAVRSSKFPEKWKMLTVEELYAFFGLLITAGHMKSCNQNYRIFWHPFYGSPIFQATMGLTRFEHLLRFIRFDDKSTRSERRKTDKLCPIRNIWEKVTGKFSQFYVPSENLTVDEQLMPCRCRCCFIQFMPKKPDKYGIKIFWLCDSKTAYPLKGFVYTGKDGEKRAFDLAKNVVENLCCSYFGTNRNITMDNYFTSFTLAESLLSQGLTLVGTLKKNKTCVPDDFLPDRSKSEGSTMFGFRENMTLVSHVPKVGKAVLFLSTMHHNAKIITEDEKSMSEVNKHYNNTKSGVDTMDQMVHEYMIKRKTNRWPFAFFMNLLDVTNIAAYVLWCKKFPAWNSKKSNKRNLFLRVLGEELVSPLIQQREKIPQLNNASRSAISNFSAYVNNSDRVNKSSSTILSPPDEIPPPDAKRRRCHMCPYQKSKKQKQICNKCMKNVCNEHSTSTRMCSACKE